jgi:hypothetical protein
MTQADNIREFVNRIWIEPPRKAGRSEVTVRSGDVHTDMCLESRMPAVCSALDAGKFEDTFRVRKSRRAGPKQSSTVEWTIAILP